MTEPGTTLARRMDGLLFFPVTPFGSDGEVDVHAYRRHLHARLDAGPAAIFACCGTGEFFSLGVDEYAAAVEVAVEVSDGRVPVIAGVGYGTALAGAFADAAAEAGADGLLAMPPYLADGGQAGLLAHYQRLADRAGLQARLEMLPVHVEVDLATGAERGHREEQQAVHASGEPRSGVGHQLSLQ